MAHFRIVFRQWIEHRHRIGRAFPNARERPIHRFRRKRQVDHFGQTFAGHEGTEFSLPAEPAIVLPARRPEQWQGRWNLVVAMQARQLFNQVGFARNIRTAGRWNHFYSATVALPRDFYAERTQNLGGFLALYRQTEQLFDALFPQGDRRHSDFDWICISDTRYGLAAGDLRE